MAREKIGARLEEGDPCRFDARLAAAGFRLQDGELRFTVGNGSHQGCLTLRVGCAQCPSIGAQQEVEEGPTLASPHGFERALGIPAVQDVLIFLFGGPRLHPSFGLDNLAFGLGVILLVSVISTLWPAIIATRIQPVIAMQKE